MGSKYLNTKSRIWSNILFPFCISSSWSLQHFPSFRKCLDSILVLFPLLRQVFNRKLEWTPADIGIWGIQLLTFLEILSSRSAFNSSRTLQLQLRLRKNPQSSHRFCIIVNLSCNSKRKSNWLARRSEAPGLFSGGDNTKQQQFLNHKCGSEHLWRINRQYKCTISKNKF